MNLWKQRDINSLIIYTNSLNFGGAERFTCSLANALVCKSWSVLIIVNSLSNDNLSSHLNSAVSLKVLDTKHRSPGALARLRALLARFFRLRAVIRAEKPSAVLGVMTTSGLLAIIASIGLKHRVVVSERTYPPKSEIGWLKALCRKFFYRRAVIVAQTEDGAEWLKNNTKAKRVVAIPNFVSSLAEVFSDSSDGIHFIKAPETNVLLSVSRLIESKNVDRVVQIFGDLRSKGFSDWELWIAGDGPERRKLEMLASALPCASSIKFLGLVSNVASIYRLADLYILLSDLEGFPNSLLEAQSFGVPSIAFDCKTGPKDIISATKGGFLVCVGDYAEAASQLELLMASKKERDIYRRNSLKNISFFEQDEIISRWEILLQPNGSIN